MGPLYSGRLFRGFDEDYVNDEENALLASFSKSSNLEYMTQFPSNLLVIKIDSKFLACFFFLGNCLMFPINFSFDKNSSVSPIPFPLQ